MKDRTDYDRIKDLSYRVQYYSRPLSAYGYNPKTGELNTKLFPTTQTDTQMKGIKSDIDRVNKAVADYYEYEQHLAGKYDLDLGEAKKCNERLPYHVPKLKMNKKRRRSSN